MACRRSMHRHRAYRPEALPGEAAERVPAPGHAAVRPDLPAQPVHCHQQPRPHLRRSRRNRALASPATPYDRVGQPDRQGPFRSIECPGHAPWQCRGSADGPARPSMNPDDIDREQTAEPGMPGSAVANVTIGNLPDRLSRRRHHRSGEYSACRMDPHTPCGFRSRADAPPPGRLRRSRYVAGCRPPEGRITPVPAERRR